MLVADHAFSLLVTYIGIYQLAVLGHSLDRVLTVQVSDSSQAGVVSYNHAHAHQRLVLVVGYSTCHCEGLLRPQAYGKPQQHYKG